MKIEEKTNSSSAIVICLECTVLEFDCYVDENPSFQDDKRKLQSEEMLRVSYKIPLNRRCVLGSAMKPPNVRVIE